MAVLQKRPTAATSKLAGSTRLLTVADHGNVIRADQLAGSVITLPKATGRRTQFRIEVGTLATSNSHIIKVGNAVDVFRGVILGARTDVGNAVLGFAAGATDDTITLNRGTTGSANLGEWLEFEDTAAGIWSVRGVLSATGAAFATPFSATVS